ncbi:MAG: hypothetical protein ACM31C_02630, partial [Acidobacteriota bacterium]
MRCSWFVIAIALGGCVERFSLDGNGAGNSTSIGGGGDLPCDVAQVLSDHCTSCHSSPPTGGAPYPLVTYGDLTAPVAGVTRAQRALIRMTSAAMPMPPLPAAAVPADQVGVFQAWLASGMPTGSCGISDPFSGPSVCTSGAYWNGGEGGGMAPGEACIACHKNDREAPKFTIAGTVYATGHEPNDCDGTNTAPSVVITDANGATLTLPVNGAGNFYAQAAVAFPIKAEVHA